MGKLAIILIVALLFEAVGVVLLSQGLKEIGEMRQFTISEVLRVAGLGMVNRNILLGVGFESIFFITLLVMLKNWDVSLIWPLTSLGFVLTTLCARYVRHEEVTALRWSGVILIMAGAALVGWSVKPKNPEPISAAIQPSELRQE